MDPTLKDQRPRYSSDAMIMLTHVPKCAGTSLREAIMQATEIPQSMQYRPGSGIKTIMLQHPDDFQCLIGHFPWGIHHVFRPWSTVAQRRKIHIATLRDPIDQMLSFYYFQKQLGAHSAYRDKVASAKDILDFYRISPECANLQTKMYAGFPFSRFWKPSQLAIGSEALLRRAYLNLTNRYHYWVHHSFLDESIKCLSKGLGVSIYLEKIPLTITRERQYTDDLSDRTISGLREINFMDLNLHSTLNDVMSTFIPKNRDIKIESSHSSLANN